MHRTCVGLLPAFCISAAGAYDTAEIEGLLGVKLTDLYEGNASALRVLGANGALCWDWRCAVLCRAVLCRAVPCRAIMSSSRLVPLLAGLESWALAVLGEGSLTTLLSPAPTSCLPSPVPCPLLLLLQTPLSSRSGRCMSMQRSSGCQTSGQRRAEARAACQRSQTSRPRLFGGWRRHSHH
jgi:hypothetical protein